MNLLGFSSLMMLVLGGLIYSSQSAHFVQELKHMTGQQSGDLADVFQRKTASSFLNIYGEYPLTAYEASL